MVKRQTNLIGPEAMEAPSCESNSVGAPKRQGCRLARGRVSRDMAARSWALCWH